MGDNADNVVDDTVDDDDTNITNARVMDAASATRATGG